MGRIVGEKYDNPVEVPVSNLTFVGVTTMTPANDPEKYYVAVQGRCVCGCGRDLYVRLPDRDAVETLIAMLRDHQDAIDRETGGEK
jgi:hypothetical protein